MPRFMGQNTEGKDRPAPKDGFRLYAFLLYTYFWRFIALNLLFLLFSLPVVTLPASLCGLNRVLVRLIQDGNCFLWLDFRDEFKSSFRKSILPGLCFALGLFVSYYLLSLGLSNAQSIYGMFFSATGLALAAFCLILGAWFFALASMLPLANRDLLRNARALIGLAPLRSLFILCILLCAFSLLLFFFPLSLLLFGLFLCAFLQYNICFLVYGPVQNWIVRPYTER